MNRIFLIHIGFTKQSDVNRQSYKKTSLYEVKRRKFVDYEVFFVVETEVFVSDRSLRTKDPEVFVPEQNILRTTKRTKVDPIKKLCFAL